MSEASENSDLSALLAPLFNADGSCPTLGDPYRDRTPTAGLIFDEDGDLKYEVEIWLNQFIHETPTVKPLSDIVRIIMADDFASNTKGNYSAIYMWR